MRTVGCLLLLAGTLTACGASAGGQAPTLAGRPVLVEFWTFG